MGDTSTRVTVEGHPLTPRDLALVRSIDVAETINAQTQVSLVVDCNVTNAGDWQTPFDTLVAPFAKFQVEIERNGDRTIIPARATSASWSLQPGALSTLTIAGLDATADLDRKEQSQAWGAASDADIARSLLTPLARPRIGKTSLPAGTRGFTPHQRSTNWAYLRSLAERNDFDVYLTTEDGALVSVFDQVNPVATPKDTLDLGYGVLGGSAAVQVQLATGQRVKFAYGISGEREPQVAEDNGTGTPMGTQSLGGATTVLRDQNDLPGIQQPQVAARVLAERSAFGATLSVTLTAPATPLLHSRRTVQVRGLGPLISGLWLVQSVRHTITQGGHTQALTLTRNALGDAGPSPAAGPAAALSGVL